MLQLLSKDTLYWHTQESTPIPWPPTAQQLEEESEDVLPECLKKYLMTLMFKRDDEASTVLID